jgi:hypothetical protein
MLPRDEWHRLTNLQPDLSIADCAICGPGIKVKHRKHKGEWSCAVIQEKRGPERPERKRQYQRASRPRLYGLTADDYQSLLAQQGSACAICQTEPSTEPLVIDHCHQTGTVRGLLCRNCNVALGFMQDDPQLLLRAVSYLQSTRTPRKVPHP